MAKLLPKKPQMATNCRNSMLLYLFSNHKLGLKQKLPNKHQNNINKRESIGLSAKAERPIILIKTSTPSDGPLPLPNLKFIHLKIFKNISKNLNLQTFI